MHNNCSTEAKQIELSSEDNIMRNFYRKTLIDAGILWNDRHNMNWNSCQFKKAKTKQFNIMNIQILMSLLLKVIVMSTKHIFACGLIHF